jgi:hypothetical protein
MKKQMFFVCMLVAALLLVINPAWARLSDGSNTTAVNVLNPPVINSLTPESQELYADDDTTLIEANITAGDDPTLTIEWLQSLDEGDTWDTAPDSDNSDTYQPPVVNALYMITVTDGNGLTDTSGVAAVIVYAVPTVVIDSVPASVPPSPASGVISVVPGVPGGIVMTATAHGGWGVPDYTYIWKMSTDGGTTWVDASGAGLTIVDNVLTIDPVTEGNQAIYQCFVDDGHVE